VTLGAFFYPSTVKKAFNVTRVEVQYLRVRTPEHRKEHHVEDQMVTHFRIAPGRVLYELEVYGAM